MMPFGCSAPKRLLLRPDVPDGLSSTKAADRLLQGVHGNGDSAPLNKKPAEASFRGGFANASPCRVCRGLSLQVRARCWAKKTCPPEEEPVATAPRLIPRSRTTGCASRVLRQPRRCAAQRADEAAEPPAAAAARRVVDAAARPPGHAARARVVDEHPDPQAAGQLVSWPAVEL